MYYLKYIRLYDIITASKLINNTLIIYITITITITIDIII